MTAARLLEMTVEAVLPASLEAERSILGAIMLDNHAYDEASQSLSPDDFSLDSHRRLYCRMAEMVAANTPIDLVTLSEDLARHREVEAIGGVAYVSALVDGLPRRPSIDHYVR